MLDAIDLALEPLRAMAGLPMDQFKFVLAMVATYPLSYLWRILPGANAKHAFGVVVGLSLLVFCLGPLAWVHSMVTSLVTYAAVRLLRPRAALRFVFVFAFAYLSGSHIYRTLTDYMGWSLDFTGSQMIITLKLIGFAFNLYDANVKLLVPRVEGIADEKARRAKERVIKNIEALDRERQEYALTSVPSLLEFLGFIYFPAGLLAGPVFEFREYRDCADGTMFKKLPGGLPSTFVPALKAVARAAVMMVLVLLAARFPLSHLSTPQFEQEWSQLQRWGYLYVCMTLIRCKYYFGWFLAEGACIVSGLGFHGMDKSTGEAKWDRCNNVSPRMVELPENARSISAGWNSRVALWLRRYVYLRVGKLGEPTSLSTYATFVVSAFWHGFYPGYYISFVSGALFVETARVLRRDLGPLFAANGPLHSLHRLYDVAATVSAMWVFAYMCGSFQLLDAMLSYRLMRSLYFLPHIVSAAVLAVMLLVGPQLRRWAQRHGPSSSAALQAE